MKRILTELNEEQLKQLVKEVVDHSILNGIMQAPKESELELLSVNEACELLKIKRTTLYKHLNQGNLQGYKVGQKTCFLKQDIESFIRQNPINK